MGDLVYAASSDFASHPMRGVAGGEVRKTPPRLRSSQPKANLAGLDLRWLAKGVDVGLAGGVTALGGFLGVGAAHVLGVADTWGAVTTMAAALAGLLALMGLNLALIVRDGQTVGKRWTDIRIVKLDGSLPGFVHGVLLRSWALSFLNQFCGILFLIDPLFIFGASRRTLHDYIAGTQVVLASDPFTVQKELEGFE